jgi:alpha-N-arabinofuranosidase
MVNGSSVPQPVALNLSSAAKIAAGAVMETLSGKDPAETNTITDPKHLVPIKSTLKESGASFSHTMPPYSIQAIEFSLEKP